MRAWVNAIFRAAIWTRKTSIAPSCSSIAPEPDRHWRGRRGDGGQQPHASYPALQHRDGRLLGARRHLEDVYLTVRQSGGTSSVAQSRTLTLVLGVLAAAVGCSMHDVIGALTVGYDLLVGAVFVPTIAAMCSVRGEPLAASVSIVVSAAIVIVLLWVKGIDSLIPLYGGLAASLTLFVGISRLIRHRPPSLPYTN